MAIPDFKRIRFLIPVAAVGVALAGCGSSGSTSSPSSQANSNSASAEAQSAATGDIPDNQTFLTYKNRRAGYSILYPEGWARKGSASTVSFSDKDNQVRVALTSRAAAHGPGREVRPPEQRCPIASKA